MLALMDPCHSPVLARSGDARPRPGVSFRGSFPVHARVRHLVVLFLHAMVILPGPATVSSATATDLLQVHVKDVASLAGVWTGTVAGGTEMRGWIAAWASSVVRSPPARQGGMEG